MLRISHHVTISRDQLSFRTVRSQGPGGQHVNKVSTAVVLRFDIRASDLPDIYKERLLALNDRRITNEGVIVIKAQSFRSQERNREESLTRLAALIRQAVQVKAKRRPTRPTRASRQRRLDAKTRHSRTKALRKKIPH